MNRSHTVFALLALLLAISCGSREALPWSDDFSNPASGWKAESDAAAEVAYYNGVLRILIKAPNSLAWASAGRAFSDFRLTVEASQVSGPDNNEYGVLVRMQDPEHFYRFSISGDGYYLVSKHDGENWGILSGQDWTPSEAIHTGQATNLLEILCRGTEMTFSVNGIQVAQVRDASYTRGDIALYAGAFFETEVEVHFDNLRVSAP
ncbi:MAG: DUF1080 domain-containing protein [Anaerolineae bacterium]|nr:DUF1080 domain-containing protein [Anaerolineae bacterium]